MIIRSQNKKQIVKFKKATACESGDVYISGNYMGTYSTKEKAIKVLDMIQNAYTQYGTIKNGLGSIHGAFNIPKCFQMPSDEEVEV
ncbi:MAG: hypothetical protein IJZ23_06980 [Roseburia sp.]|nr:hypothetical protein [Roseburia sp.]MBQ8279569.1 hypothetical protein [Roseburia sp.]